MKNGLLRSLAMGLMMVVALPAVAGPASRIDFGFLETPPNQTINFGLQGVPDDAVLDAFVDEAGIFGFHTPRNDM